MNEKICQSCAMPMREEKEFGRNADGTINEEYCCYCYSNGAFTKEETMEEMVEECIPFLLEGGTYPDADTARAQMMSYFPQLKRWKGDSNQSR